MLMIYFLYELFKCEDKNVELWNSAGVIWELSKRFDWICLCYIHTTALGKDLSSSQPITIEKRSNLLYWHVNLVHERIADIAEKKIINLKPGIWYCVADNYGERKKNILRDL